MRRSITFALVAVAALLALALLPSTASAADQSNHAVAVRTLRAHGYLPTMGADRLGALKAQAAVAEPAAAQPAGPLAPVAGPSFQGQDENDLAPSDSTGAVGPNSFIEMINTRIAIYTRAGALIASAPSEALTGTGHFDLSDPQVFWDPATNRFYYEILNVANDTLEIGFSKSNNPVAIPGSFCNYDVNYGYGANLPDFPKLGDTQHSLLIGVNVFAGNNFIGSDVDWMTKPAGNGVIGACPAFNTFKTGKTVNLKTPAGAQVTTPVPAQETDTSPIGWIAATPNTLPAAQIDLFRVPEAAGGTPIVPVVATSAVAVAAFNVPPNAPQLGSGFQLDTLDGRLLHAVSAIDPARGLLALWTAHAVAGGAGAQSRWYEINVAGNNLFQAGVATNAALFVFNPAISPDRTVQPAGAAFGSNMVLGFTTSSGGAFPAIQMVSKVGAGAQSAFVLVKASAGADQGFDCVQLGFCRWGDYSGASPDPAANRAGARGDVWLVNMWSKGGGVNGGAAEWGTWNWQAVP